MVMYVLQVLRPIRYWTLWMLKRHTVTLHHVFTVYNDMLDHMHGIMWALAEKKTHSKEDLFFAEKLAGQQLLKYYAEVTSSMAMLLISGLVLDHFQKLPSCRKWDTGIDINSKNKTSYTAQSQEAFRMYVEYEYCAKHQHVPVNKPKSFPNKNLVPFVMTLRSGQLSFDPYDLSSDDVKYLTRNNVDEMPPGQRNWFLQHTYWPLPGSIWIHHLKHQRTGGKLIALSMITTPTQWRLAVHVAYWT